MHKQGQGQSKAAQRRAKEAMKKVSSSSSPSINPAPSSSSSSSSLPKKRKSEHNEKASKSDKVKVKKPKEMFKESKFKKSALWSDDDDDEPVADEEEGEENEEDENEELDHDEHHESDSESDPDQQQQPDFTSTSTELSPETFAAQSHELLSTLIYPTAPATFYKTNYGQLPLFTNRLRTPHPEPLDPFVMKQDVVDYISKQSLKYGGDINVTNVSSDGVFSSLDIINDNETTSVGAVADINDVLSNFGENQCTVKLNCPQKYSDTIWDVLSTLETEFGCVVNASLYLTPKNSTGYMLKFSSFDKYVLQQEGSKVWKVYKPLDKHDVLPRTSSTNETVFDTLPKKPYMEVTLTPGDLLYIPRGWLHVASTENANAAHEYSLHLTIETSKSWTWTDLLELVLPKALEQANFDDISLREGLPRKFLGYMGVMNDNDDMLNTATTVAGRDKKNIDSRLRFRLDLKSKIQKIVTTAMTQIDFGCDELSKRYLSERLPPAFTPDEIALTNENGNGNNEICAESLVRISREGIARLVIEDNMAIVYFSTENDRSQNGETLMNPLEFELDDAPAIELLFKTTCPMWVKVNDLPHAPKEDLEDKIGIVEALFNEGLICLMQPDFISERVNKKGKA